MARPIILGRLKSQYGFGYVTVLFIVLLLAIAVGSTYEQMETIVKRENEQQLMFAGKQYQQAIASYYRQSPEGLKELPSSLDDLLLDKRFVAKTRHLRKRFIDPITGGDWGLILNDNSQIKGVYSTSNAQVLQTAKLFNSDIAEANPVQVYSDIKFEFNPSGEPAVTDVEQEDMSLGNVEKGGSLLE